VLGIGRRGGNLWVDGLLDGQAPRSPMPPPSPLARLIASGSHPKLLRNPRGVRSAPIADLAPHQKDQQDVALIARAGAPAGEKKAGSPGFTPPSTLQGLGITAATRAAHWLRPSKQSLKSLRVVVRKEAESFPPSARKPCGSGLTGGAHRRQCAPWRSWPWAVRMTGRSMPRTRWPC